MLTVWSWFTSLLVIAAVAAVAVAVDGSMLRDIVCRPGTDQNQAPYFKLRRACRNVPKTEVAGAQRETILTVV
jgi:hypothetical protein